MVSKTLFEFAGAAVVSLPDDSMAGKLTAEVTNVNGSGVVRGRSATLYGDQVPARRQALEWVLKGKPYSS